MNTKQSTISVLMLPWLAYGHISPFLELAKKLSHRNFHIYLCSTPINLKSIKNRITERYSHSIELIEIHLPSLPELPPHYHTTNGLPTHLNSALNTAFEMSSPSFFTILNTLTPDLVIHDFTPSWAPTIASSFNILAVQLETSGFHETRFHYTIENAAKKSKDKQAAPVNDRHEMKPPCKIVLHNTFRELEGKCIDYLSDIGGTKVLPVGPLVKENIDDENENSEIIQWLDNKDESSTLFVSFGSEYFMSKEEIEEIAHGLEVSKVNFIWVVRFPVGEKVELEEALPKGFIERVGERGMVVEGWAPQARILAHSSTGGFVSHCGWNSVLESLTFGIPIVAMVVSLMGLIQICRSCKS